MAASARNDDPANVAENRRRMAEQIGVAPEHFLSVLSDPFARRRGGRQDRGKARRGRAPTPSSPAPKASRIGATAADCGPILFVDPNARVIGAAHAGWKGALTGILESTVDAMEKLGAERSGIVAAIGPLIRQHSYEVGGEFVERFIEADAEQCAVLHSRGARRPFDVRPRRLHPDAARKCRRTDDRRHRHRHLFRRALLTATAARCIARSRTTAATCMRSRWSGNNEDAAVGRRRDPAPFK